MLGIDSLQEKYEVLKSYLNERTLRIWSAAEALSLKRGGISQVAKATGISRTTIYVGIKELERDTERGMAPKKTGGIRKKGGGRKKITEKDPGLMRDLESLIEPVTRGDPESPLRWTCKSTTKIAAELRAMGHSVSQRKVCDLLHELGYSLQSNRKSREGSTHADRDAQFHYIWQQVLNFQAGSQPVISVDTKKKELIGDFKNGGREWAEKGKPVEVNVHDFVDPVLGKVVPYGVYDLTADRGWVSVGIDHDTAEFAVESIRRWWKEMGSLMYTEATEILITADCGGSNGNRVRLWKRELQSLADEMNLQISVSHFPPGTSKWNRIEHKMFCHISQNWRGRPLTSREVVVKLIANATTQKGLEIRALLDEKRYPTGIKISDDEFKSIAIERSDFHGEWNYTINPRKLAGSMN